MLQIKLIKIKVLNIVIVKLLPKMGCQSSTTNVLQLYGQNPDRTNVKSGFKENQRSKLLQAIQWNDACDFALASQQNNIPMNGQLSQSGLFWMASHFCCRWNSYKVLDYVLKNAYNESPKNYVKFVNQKTIQGYTCLHLCVIWNASQCFDALLKFGGINLQTKDKIQATPYLTAINYKRNQMRNHLKQFQDLKISFLVVQHQKISSGEILVVQTANTQRNVKKPTQYVPRLDGGLKNILGNSFFQTEKQKQIQAQKKKIEQQKQNIRLQLRKIEQEQAKKHSQSLISAQQQKKVNKQRRIEHKQKRLIEQMKKKQGQLNKLKSSLLRISEQKQQSILKQQKKNSQQFLHRNENRLVDKISIKNSVIQQQRQSILKNRIQRGPMPENKSNLKEEVYGKLPAELQGVYDQATRAGLFVDSAFPQTEASIGNTPKAKKFLTDLIWLRPKQIFKGEYHLFDGIDPNDIKQGSLGVCYMLATLSTLAQYPERIRDIFVFYDKSLGFYVLKMLIHGEIKYVVVDDAIPCNKSTKSPLFAKPNGNELWVCLVQKTWAKCVGNYMKTQSMTPNHLMEDLTTCPSFGVWFKDKTQKTKDIDFHIKMKNIVVLTSLADKKIQGIVNNHAYSLLSLYEHEGKIIYKVRNPWGKFEWNGQYNDKSSFWTQQLKKKLGHVDADDGVFFLSESQLLQAFVYYSISITKLNHRYSFVPLKTQRDENKYLTFQITEDQSLNLRFVQKFDRMLDNPNYKYSPVIFQVGRVQPSGQVTFLTEGDNKCFWGGKSVHADPDILKKYQKGKYFVRLAVQWQNQEKCNSGIFGIFSPKQVEINELSNEQGQKLWVQLMKNFAIKKATPTVNKNIQYINIWMRGQMVCCAYGKQTQNSQKFQAKWTFDSKKFVNCTLGLNQTGPNEIRYQVGKRKQNANLGTLRRLLINQSCITGNISISATAL